MCTDGEVMKICVPEDYMKFELPVEGASTLVSIGVDIKDIPKVRRFHGLIVTNICQGCERDVILFICRTELNKMGNQFIFAG